MFKSLTYLILLSLSGISFSQLEITNEGLIYPERRILYRGMTNYIKVKEADSLVLIMVNSDGDTFYPKDDSYYYRANTKKDFDTLSFFMNDQLIDTAIFEVRKLKLPSIFLGEIDLLGIKDSVVSRNYLLTNPGFHISYYPDIARADIYVYDFDVHILKENGKKINLRDERWKVVDSLDNQTLLSDDPDKAEEELRKYQKENVDLYENRNMFNQSALHSISAAKKGDVLYIKSVLYKSPDSRGVQKSLNLALVIE